ncbi:hypothetical protein SAMN02745751_01901 [Dethiosulfatibacter aminovorans DSM 17477]|uniref:Uncharacterized protein n=1 Tax=Dethiosulfatibacter aminovorans DSM 17477 TaxID=1121476 RepID=A0A1M6H3K1_9FIRM|nr:hypothetical protein SAMN02745751_01901 [Dethiosulfatibacter aminovorans DSM 17477]
MGYNRGVIVKLFEDFSLEDLLIKIFVPDANKVKPVDPFDMAMKENKNQSVNDKKYNKNKKSG